MNVLNYFSKLYKEKQELVLMVWAYLAIIAASILIAGLLALFNQALGVGVLIVPLVALTAMCMNIVTWALIKLAAETFLPKKPVKKAKK